MGKRLYFNGLLGPPFIRTYREAMQWHYMPNLDWWGVTLCELYAVRIWVGYHRRREALHTVLGHLQSPMPRRFQFSLRTLMIVVTLLVIPCA